MQFRALFQLLFVVLPFAFFAVWAPAAFLRAFAGEKLRYGDGAAGGLFISIFAVLHSSDDVCARVTTAQNWQKLTARTIIVEQQLPNPLLRCRVPQGRTLNNFFFQSININFNQTCVIPLIHYTELNSTLGIHSLFNRARIEANPEARWRVQTANGRGRGVG